MYKGVLMSERDYYHVSISVKKVQRFIFQFPTLKCMLGANAALGEFFYSDLFNLKVKCDKEISSSNVAKTQVFTNNSDISEDNPNLLFKKGILCSAGGHFEALFKNQDNAVEFITQSINLAKEKLPNLKISYDIKKLLKKQEYKKFKLSASLLETDPDILSKILNDTKNELFLDNPFFELSADGFSSNIIDKDLDVEKLLEAQGNRFYILKSKNYLSFLYKKLFENNDIKIQDFSFNFEGIKKKSTTQKKNLLAIIAIDGNDMGKLFREKENSLNNKPALDAFLEIEQFWYSKRSGMRRALLKTLSENQEFCNLPYQIMMLGGDDLLIVSTPEFAFNFLDKFHNNYKNLCKDSSFCAGIAFTKFNYPFIHGHALAESLLSSAKTKIRKLDKKDQFAIDWHILYSTMPEDIEDIRRRDYLMYYKQPSNETLEILSLRPYLISEAIDIHKTAVDLNNDFQTKDKKIGRNKIKSYRTSLKKGLFHADYIYNQLFKNEYPYLKPLPGKVMYNLIVRTCNALDYIELLDVLPQKKEIENENINHEV